MSDAEYQGSHEQERDPRSKRTNQQNYFLRSNYRCSSITTSLCAISLWLPTEPDGNAILPHDKRAEEWWEGEKEKSRRLYNYQECSQDLTCVQSGTKPFDGFFSRKTVCRRTDSAGMISSLLGKRYSESSERKTPRRSPGPSTGPSESLWGCASPVPQWKEIGQLSWERSLASQ